MYARYRWLAAGLLVLLTASCSSGPTGPSFDFAGTWRGQMTDYSFFSIVGDPLGGLFTLVVHEDGSATASGQAQASGGSSFVAVTITADLTVYPDGSVDGTGSYDYSQTGYTPLGVST